MGRVLLTVALLGALATLVSAKCGWELEVPKINVYHVNPKTKEFLEINVRDEVPIHANRKKLDNIELDLKKNGAAFTPDKSALFTGDPAIWRWTVDGLTHSTGPISYILSRADSKAAWVQAVTDYNNANPTAKLTAADTDNVAGTVTAEAVTKVNDMLISNYRKAWAKNFFGTPLVAMNILQPQPVAVKPQKFARFSIKNKHYVHRDPTWAGWAVPAAVSSGDHNKGFQAILELKTQVPDGDGPIDWSADNINKVRLGFAEINKLLSEDDVSGTITVKVSATDHWILKLHSGKKYDTNKDVQFTFNVALEDIGACGDMPFGWPAAPITDSQTALQKHTQRYVMKLATQTSDDKNNMSPYIKTMDLLTPHKILGSGGAAPYKATKDNVEAGVSDRTVPNILDWISANPTKVDAFVKACMAQQKVSTWMCLAPYYNVDGNLDEFPKSFEKASKNYVIAEERVPNSKASKFPFQTKDTDHTALFNAYPNACLV